MASLTEWQTLDPSSVERAVTVMVPTECYVNGEAYYAMTALPWLEAENLGILTRKERKMVDSGLEHMVEHSRESSVTAIGLSCTPHGFVQ